MLTALGLGNIDEPSQIENEEECNSVKHSLIINLFEQLDNSHQLTDSDIDEVLGLVKHLFSKGLDHSDLRDKSYDTLLGLGAFAKDMTKDDEPAVRPMNHGLNTSDSVVTIHIKR
jgi:hypothetical protein